MYEKVAVIDQAKKSEEPQKTYFAETVLEFCEILRPEVKLIRRRQSSELLPLSSERGLNKNTCNRKKGKKKKIRLSRSHTAFIFRKNFITFRYTCVDSINIV